MTLQLLVTTDLLYIFLRIYQRFIIFFPAICIFFIHSFFYSFIYLFHYTVYLMSIYSMCIFFSYFPFFTQDRIKDFLDSLLSSISVLSSPFNYSNFPLLIIYIKICCVFVL